ncbi:hypothetical protein ACIP79_18960 [Streptomyces sp. NPDC088747]|uniref:hypothetical protein n=1 Tax=Streptomyces sp. NPDC088747 TaxID=3365886 RepID=UPI0037FA5944
MALPPGQGAGQGPGLSGIEPHLAEQFGHPRGEGIAPQVGVECDDLAEAVPDALAPVQ